MGDMSRLCLFAVAVVLLEGTPLTASFTSQYSPVHRVLVGGSPAAHCQRRSPVVLHANDDLTYDPEEEVKRRLVRAKEVLEKSKAKLKSKEEDNDKDTKNKPKVSKKSAKSEAPLPFFAAKTKVADSTRREQVIKATNEKTGLVRADGEKMAAMSETEEWENRSLLEVFENTIDENADVYSMASKQLAERDVVASVWNLRKVMKTEDYLKIFDKRNFFIGENN